jgi:nucleotide-binding universal stress UspA family protein
MSYVRQRVVVPFDFTEPSLEALRTAREFVTGPAHLYAIHVVTDRGDERQALQRLEKALAEAGLGDARPAVASGDPAAAIVKHAERVGADLVVIPSRGGSGLSRLLLGSVALEVVRSSSCPVLVLRR